MRQAGHNKQRIQSCIINCVSLLSLGSLFSRRSQTLPISIPTAHSRLDLASIRTHPYILILNTRFVLAHALYIILALVSPSHIFAKVPSPWCVSFFEPSGGSLMHASFVNAFQ